MIAQDLDPLLSNTEYSAGINKRSAIKAVESDMASSPPKYAIVFTLASVRITNPTTKITVVISNACPDSDTASMMAISGLDL